MQEAFAAGCCPARWSAGAGGAGSTGARGKFGCRTHPAEQVGVQKSLDGFQRRRVTTDQDPPLQELNHRKLS